MPDVLFLADAACILIFVVIGRSSHEEGLTLSGILVTAAPFWIAMGVAWLVPVVRRSPKTVVSGAIVWADTLIIGMALRRFVFDEGIAPTFIIVASIFLAITMFGWRLITNAIATTSA